MGTNGLVQVSNTGRVRSLGIKGRPAHEYKLCLDGWGYPIVSLSLWGTRKNVKVHRLVAMNFVPNPDGKSQVNHKNGDKTDNRAENLEWVTPSENCKHREDIVCKGEHPSGKKKRKVICISTGEIFDSVHAANIYALGRKGDDISRAIKYNFNCGGKRWAYMKEAADKRRKEIREKE